MLKAANLGIAFLLELAMLAALAYGGFQASSSSLLSWGLGIGVPMLAAVIWGLFLAPRSNRRLRGASYLLLKTLLFGAAVIVLAAAGQTQYALIFTLIAVINQALLFIWNQE